MVDTTLTVKDASGASKTLVAEVSGSDLIMKHVAVGPAGAALALDATILTLLGKFPSSIGAKVGSNSLSVVPATDGFAVGGNVASGAADSGNPVKVGGVYNSSFAALGAGQRADLQLSDRGELRIQIASGGVQATLPTQSSRGESNTSGVAGMRVYARMMIQNGTTTDPLVKPNAVSRIPSAAGSTNVTSAKASAGEVHAISAYNTTAAVKFLKLYNKVSAPTVGTDVPVLTLAIPPNGSLAISFPNGGQYFSTGIAYALTGAAADTDATALAAGDIVGLNISYS